MIMKTIYKNLRSIKYVSLKNTKFQVNRIILTITFVLPTYLPLLTNIYKLVSQRLCIHYYEPIKTLNLVKSHTKTIKKLRLGFGEYTLDRTHIF